MRSGVVAVSTPACPYASSGTTSPGSASVSKGIRGSSTLTAAWWFSRSRSISSTAWPSATSQPIPAMLRSSCGRAASGPTVGNTALNLWPRKWISGDSSCETHFPRETFAVRETRFDKWRALGLDDAPANRRATAPRPARSPAHACARPRRQKPQAYPGIYSYGQRYRRHDHSSRRLCPGHQVHSGKSKNAGARRSERCAFATDESGRLTHPCGVPVPRAPVWEYRFPPEYQLTIREEPASYWPGARPECPSNLSWYAPGPYQRKRHSPRQNASLSKQRSWMKSSTWQCVTACIGV